MRKYGQHFLKSKNIVDKIIMSADLNKEDIVLEIGPGKGVLTKEISKKVKKVYAVEIDKELADELSLLKLRNVSIINKDILKYEFPEDVTKIISNLPYEISAPITEKIIDFGKPAILMYQKEFVQRMTAKPGEKDYSRLTILINHLADIKVLMNVSRLNFKPQPRVDSTVIELKPKRVKKDKNLLAIASILFRHKRKNIIPALMSEKDTFSIKDKKKLREELSKRIQKTGIGKRVINLDLSEIDKIKESIRSILRNS